MNVWCPVCGFQCGGLRRVIPLIYRRNWRYYHIDRCFQRWIHRLYPGDRIDNAVRRKLRLQAQAFMQSYRP